MRMTTVEGGASSPTPRSTNPRERSPSLRDRVANVVPIPIKPVKRAPRSKLVHQFLIVLSGTNPLVWRRIQVPEKYSFWDLHVAIQDAMGWLDYHLHEFRLVDAAEQNVVSI